MFKNFPVIVDTVQKSKLNNIVVNSNDLQTFKLSLTINQLNKPIDLTGATVRIAIVKPDKTTVFQDCTITDPTTGSCEVVLNTQAFIISGVYIAEVMIYFGADTVAVTGRFSYSVTKGILDDSTAESTNEWQSITQAIADAEGILIDLRENGTGIDIEARSGLETVTTQLADTVMGVEKSEQRLRELKTPYKTYSGGIVTFSDDDGYATFMTVMKPLYDELGIKANIAVNTSTLGTSGYLTYEQLKTLITEGFEVSSHGHSGEKLSTLTDEQKHFQLSESKRLLKENGIDCNTYIYSVGAVVGDINTKNIIKQYYDCGANSGGQYPIYQPIDSYELPRFECSTRTLASAKLLIDLAFDNNGWVHFYSHSHQAPYATEERKQFFRDVVAYIRGKNMPIVTLSEGLEMKGNIIEVGDQTNGNNYYLTKQGKAFVNSKDITTETYKFGTDASTTPVSNDITKFPKDSTTVTRHQANTTNAPVVDAGICMTYRPSDNTDSYSMQLFLTLKNDMYVRVWSGGVFKDWQALNTTQFKGSSDASKLITSYPLNSLTIEYVSSTVGGNASPALPTTQKKGVMKTFRFFPNAEEYSYQEWKPFDGAEVWQRSWNKTSTIWGTWAKINAV